MIEMHVRWILCTISLPILNYIVFFFHKCNLYFPWESSTTYNLVSYNNIIIHKSYKSIFSSCLIYYIIIYYKYIFKIHKFFLQNIKNYFSIRIEWVRLGLSGISVDMYIVYTWTGWTISKPLRCLSTYVYLCLVIRYITHYTYIHRSIIPYYYVPSSIHLCELVNLKHRSYVHNRCIERAHAVKL